jgi:predicted GIY-YIG superfamily endonuclease
MKLCNHLQHIYDALESSALQPFKYPVPRMLEDKKGIYTIWYKGKLEYAGVSNNLHERLEKHRSGSRSGDKFNIHVADKRIMNSLTSSQISSIATGSISFDKLIRAFVQENYGFRYYFNDELPEEIAKKDFCKVETQIKNVGLGASGRPFLNGRGISVKIPV